MFCAISGDVPKEPVVSKNNGLLFEKRLIEKVIKETGKCPVTGSDLNEEDLIPVRAAKVMPPRSSGPSSVSGLLYTLQQEWDETVLETFNLRQQLDTTRKELALSLYQHDAACRVIARLMKEKEEALTLLQSFKLSAINNHPYNNGNGSVPSNNNVESDTVANAEESSMDVSTAASAEPVVEAPAVELGVSEPVIAELNTMCKTLSSVRKQRKPSDKVLSKEDMAQIEEKTSFVPQSGGVQAVAVHEQFVLSGGLDHTAKLSNLTDGQVITSLVGHRGTVNTVAFGPAHTQAVTAAPVIITGSADHTVKLWRATNPTDMQYTSTFTYTNHTSPVVGVTVHPTANYFVSVQEDSGVWHFVDLVRGAPLKLIGNVQDASVHYSAACFHPDGLILGLGTKQGVFKIWDVREQKNVANLSDHTGAIQSVAFSENGYLAATGSDDGSVKIWDLRKLKSTKSFDMGKAPVNAVSFDYSGLYLGIGGGGDAGQQVHVKVVKDWSASALFPNAHTQPVTGLAWGEHATSLVTSSLDSTVKVFGKA